MSSPTESSSVSDVPKVAGTAVENGPHYYNGGVYFTMPTRFPGESSDDAESAVASDEESNQRINSAENNFSGAVKGAVTKNRKGVLIAIVATLVVLLVTGVTVLGVVCSSRNKTEGGTTTDVGRIKFQSGSQPAGQTNSRDKTTSLLGGEEDSPHSESTGKKTVLNSSGSPRADNPPASTVDNLLREATVGSRSFVEQDEPDSGPESPPPAGNPPASTVHINLLRGHVTDGSRSFDPNGEKPVPSSGSPPADNPQGSNTSDQPGREWTIMKQIKKISPWKMALGLLALYGGARGAKGAAHLNAKSNDEGVRNMYRNYGRENAEAFGDIKTIHIAEFPSTWSGQFDRTGADRVTSCAFFGTDGTDPPAARREIWSRLSPRFGGSWLTEGSVAHDAMKERFGTCQDSVRQQDRVRRERERLDSEKERQEKEGRQRKEEEERQRKEKKRQEVEERQRKWEEEFPEEAELKRKETEEIRKVERGPELLAMEEGLLEHDEIEPFKRLGLGATATEREVKKKYRELSTLFHPDKFPTNSEAAKNKASEVFDLITDAKNAALECVKEMLPVFSTQSHGNCEFHLWSKRGV